MKLDKNGNLDGFVKKEHHDKIVNNLSKKLRKKIKNLKQLKNLIVILIIIIKFFYLNIKKNVKIVIN